MLAELRDAERVEELARMLGGVDITDKAREHAREMLGRPAPAGDTEAPVAKAAATKKSGGARRK